MQVWRDDGLPPNVPMFITEVNIAWKSGESFVDTFGALWLADFTGAFFTSGGDGLYYFHYLPLGVSRGCNSSMGTFGMFSLVDIINYQINQPTSQYFASQLINLEWVQPGNGKHTVYPANADVSDPVGHTLVTAYAVQRPDGQWALMIINKDQENSHPVRIEFGDKASRKSSSFSGPVDVVTFGSEQYQWHAAPLTPSGGWAAPDGPALKSQIVADTNTTYTLPKASVTVLRGKIGESR
jgi:hypothetical protein